MRKLFGLVAGIAFAATVSAQINVGANFLVGFPSGDWHKAGDESIINTAFGGGIEGNYFVTEDIAVGLEVGYLAFGEKDDFGLTFTAIPITIKGEYYFLDDEFRPFVGLGIGYYLMNSKLEVGEPFDDVEATLNGFGISPRIGAVYQASDLIGIVLNVNYNVLFGQTFGGDLDGAGDVEDATNWIGIGLGVRFTVAD